MPPKRKAMAVSSSSSSSAAPKAKRAKKEEKTAVQVRIEKIESVLALSDDPSVKFLLDTTADAFQKPQESRSE